MTADMERELLSGARAVPDASQSLTTPAGIDAIATLRRRRVLVAFLNVATWALLLVWAGSVLAANGWMWLSAVLLLALAVGLPWPVIGFWNALIGVWCLHGARRGGDGRFAFGSVTPEIAITVNTAIVMTLRNEDTERALLRLRTLKASIDATGEGGKFAYFVLSDSDRADVVAQEEAAIARWQTDDAADTARIIYRRRTDNAGFKAGNLRDFASRWGADYELMLPLDADSLMTGDAVVQLVRLMEQYPKLGILQSLVVGTPSSSAFARIFQFGMRLGMRSYTAGQAWWVGDCGPYWGHNAVVRIQPFLEHCTLPELGGSAPWGGPILSHDQVEAALMRRGGFEVRVLPVEIGSFEDNPPDVIEFARRDGRWCQGNMQYVSLLGLPGLRPVSRFQLGWAVLMFLGVPAWMTFLVLLPAASSEVLHAPSFSVASAVALFLTILIMHLTPKLAGIVDAFLTPGEVKRFGGAVRFSLSAVIEIVFSLLLSAITSLRTAIFMGGLVLGKSIGWGSQRRDAGAISWRVATQAFGWHFLFSVLVVGLLAAVSPMLALLSLPFTAGFLFAIPFAVLTANPAFGRALRRGGIAAIPEDFAPPPEVLAVQPAGRG
ncbi:glucans biosynthesis glucosyltransferase MdoH [Hyphomicrobium methylovorum]|uniref:glucans biosynthesis glucosyltransferase MdoH n=1 Tax=Hyphomicrobium methylovorum TaxID=84 RepID=UPI0015E737C9|nr:glucans biosynthesis glucosyltransferase MdoH [Hyphomicrobium methylovorum]MBA2127658.1 glucans biosynthesis glucosyltransferase MdoH [Hyphomicrobium methylovorum]